MRETAQPWTEEAVLEALAFAFHIAEWESDFEDMPDNEAFETALRNAVEEHESFRNARNSMHVGDCTRQAAPCLRCHANRLDIKAARVLQILRHI